MTINNIQILSNASSLGAYNQRLTQATRQKLEELGIPYNSNITEQEGKNLIARYQDIKSNNTKQENSFSNQNQNNDNDLLERLKKLAQKLGINTQKNPDFNSLIKEVENALKGRIQTSSNDIEELQNLKSLSEDLANIQAQSNSSTLNSTSNQALMMSLEVLSLYNKNFLYR